MYKKDNEDRKGSFLSFTIAPIEREGILTKKVATQDTARTNYRQPLCLIVILQDTSLSDTGSTIPNPRALCANLCLNSLGFWMRIIELALEKKLLSEHDGSDKPQFILILLPSDVGLFQMVDRARGDICSFSNPCVPLIAQKVKLRGSKSWENSQNCIKLLTSPLP